MTISFLLALVILGALPVLGAVLTFIYRGWRGDEGALRRGVNWAAWIAVGMCGIYLAFAFAAPNHPSTPLEIFFNGQLISFLILTRYNSVAPRLLLTSLLIGVHGLWDALHIFTLPLATDLVPSWYALACAIFDLGYFGATAPVCLHFFRRLFPRQTLQKI